jgi:hypothetical protein
MEARREAFARRRERIEGGGPRAGATPRRPVDEIEKRKVISLTEFSSDKVADLGDWYSKLSDSNKQFMTAEDKESGPSGEGYVFTLRGRHWYKGERAAEQDLQYVVNSFLRNLQKRKAAEPWMLETSTMYAPGQFYAVAAVYWLFGRELLVQAVAAALAHGAQALHLTGEQPGRDRAALRKALHVLRGELGENVIVARGDEDLAVSPAALWCDAVAFVNDLRDRVTGRIQLPSDGHRPYVEAVEGAFGAEIDYAILQKLYGTDPENEKRSSPASGCKASTRYLAL